MDYRLDSGIDEFDLAAGVEVSDDPIQQQRQECVRDAFAADSAGNEHEMRARVRKKEQAFRHKCEPRRGKHGHNRVMTEEPGGNKTREETHNRASNDEAAQTQPDSGSVDEAGDKPQGGARCRVSGKGIGDQYYEY